MRVLMVGLTPHLEGGSENHIFRLISNYNDPRFQLSLLTQKGTDCKKITNIDVLEVPFLDLKNTYLRNISFILSSAFFLIFLLRKKFDIIHIHETPLFFMIPFLRMKSKVIMTIHGLNGFKHYDKKLVWTFIRPFYSFVSAFFTPGLNEKNILKKYFRKEVFFIPNGVDNSIYNFDVDVKDNITFFGRIHPQKGIVSLISAFKKVSTKYPKYSLIIIGRRNDYCDYLKNLAASLGIKNIHFIGYKSGKDLVAELKRAYIIVLPSLWDVSGTLTLFESLAAEKPLIFGKIPMIDRIVKDGETVLLVDGKSPNEIFDRIEYVIKNRKEAELMAKRGKELAIEYDWSNIAKKTIEAYEKV